MPITTNDLFAFAQVLGRERAEVWRRSAISRAYYAAYHRCRCWERTIPLLGSNKGPEGGRHQELINRLKHPAWECGDVIRDRSRASGAQLEVQRQRRVQADYALDDVIADDAVRNQLDQVREILARCDEPLPATPFKGKRL